MVRVQIVKTHESDGSCINDVRSTMAALSASHGANRARYLVTTGSGRDRSI